MNKEQILAIAMSITLSFFVVVTVLQQNILQAYLYPPPPPGSDYNQYKVGWDQAQADAYYDAELDLVCDCLQSRKYQYQ